MKSLRIIFFPVIGLILLAALVYHFLNREMASPAPSGPPALRVWADPALRLPLESPDMEHEHGLLGRFQRRSGVRAQVTYGTLVQWETETAAHAEIDLILTADRQWKQWLVDNEMLDDETPFARHVPVILMHEGSHSEGDLLAFLRNPDLRLGAGDLHGTTLGQLTAEWLTDDTYAMDDLQRQVRYMAGQADDVARAVEQHRVDAAIVWRDTALRHTRRTVYEPWPDPDVEGPNVYALLLATGPQKREAAQLMRFLAGPAAKDLLEAYGFGTVD